MPPAHNRMLTRHTLTTMLVVAGIVVLAFFSSYLAYQTPFRAYFPLYSGIAPAMMQDFHMSERNRDDWGGYPRHRWTKLTATVVVPGVGQGGATLRLRFFGGASDHERTLTVSANHRVLAQVPIRPEWQDITIALPPDAADRWSGDLVLDLQTTPLEQGGDRRELGIATWDMELLSYTGGHAPAWGTALRLALAGLLLLLIGRVAGLSLASAATLAATLVVFLACGMAGLLAGLHIWRLQGAVLTTILSQLLLMTLVLALVVRVGTRRWEQAATATTPTTRGWWLIALRCAVLFIFTVRLAGLLNPQFTHIDHEMRLQHLLLLADGKADQVLPVLEQQFEWGTREPIPYTLLSYYLLVPLTWFFGGEPSWFANSTSLMLAVKVTTVLMDASVPLLLAVLLRDAPHPHTSAAWAALCYAALPAGYLFFYDGSFPTTVGVWVVLCALAAVQVWVGHHQERHASGTGDAPRWRHLLHLALVVVLLVGGLLAYVTHIAFFSFVLAVLLASMYWGGGSAPLRSAARWLALAVGAALLLSFLLHFADYAVTLVQRTIPAYLDVILTEGQVGKDPEQFFGTPPKTFSDHMIAHFRVWPVVVAGGALAVLLLNWRTRVVTHLGLAYAALMATTLLAEVWFGLWNKHMYFAAPGVALLAGVGLAWLAQRGRAGRVVGVLLVAWLFLESTLAWNNYVLEYIIPANAF